MELQQIRYMTAIAEEQNITPLIITGVHLNDSKKAVSFAEKYPKKL